MSLDLTGGSIEQIMAGETIEGPMLQVLGHKKMAGGTGSGLDRYRLLLSDGVHSHSSAMLATQLNEKVTSGELDTFAVIRLNKYFCNRIQQDRRVMILLDVEVVALGKDVGTRLGNPNPLNPSGGGGARAASAPAPSPAPAEPLKPIANNTPATKGGSSFYGSNASTRNITPHKPSANQTLPRTPGGTQSRIHPLSSLTPYQNRWTIRVRVVSKSSVRTWSNSRGEGKLFSMNLLDESGEIKATAFRDEVDKFYDMIEVNKVYYISKASLKTADKRYSSLKNDYEMTFNSDSQITPCMEETDLPALSYNFVPIDSLSKHEANSVIDIIGVVKGVGELNTVVAKASNKEIKKRDLQLVDEGKVLVRMTLWGTDAENFNRTDNPILTCKGAKLSDWGGRSLSALASSQVTFNADIPEAHTLRGWYDTVGHGLDFNEYRNEGGSGGGNFNANWKSFADVKILNIGDKPEYFTTKATIVFTKKENSMYTACPSGDCNKKVVDQGNGTYRCEKCQKEYPNYKWRMILSANLADCTDNQWVTCFQDTAESILGKTADELGLLRENENDFDLVFEQATFKSYIFKCRTKMENYNDESRLKTVCVSATPIDFKEYSKHLLEDIAKLQ